MAIKEHGKFDFQVPKIFHVDKEMGVMVMEYLDNYTILRDCMKFLLFLRFLYCIYVF